MNCLQDMHGGWGGGGGGGNLEHNMCLCCHCQSVDQPSLCLRGALGVEGAGRG